jgi:hypothetical protein
VTTTVKVATAANAARTASAVEAASTMEPTAAAEAIATVKVASAVKAAYRPASDEPVPATIKVMTAIFKAGPEAATPEFGTARKTGAPIEAAGEPRPGADKEPSRKPTWTVITVRRALVRGISIVAVLAHRSFGDVSRPHTDANRKPLCLCEGSCAKENSNDRQYF